MQRFSRYSRALSRIAAKTSAQERNRKIDEMVIRGLQDIRPGDLVRYTFDWPVLRVVSVSPTRIETMNDAGQVISFHGVKSVAPGIRLHDPITVDDRLHKVNS